MTRHRLLRWLLALSVGASIGTAVAGQEACLTLRDRTAVAGCTDKFAPGLSATTRQSTPGSNPTVRQPNELAGQSLLFPAPVALPRNLAPIREFPTVQARQHRAEMNRHGEMGAIGLAALGLVFGVWRLRSSTAKACTSCCARMDSDSTVCERCFQPA